MVQRDDYYVAEEEQVAIIRKKPRKTMSRSQSPPHSLATRLPAHVACYSHNADNSPTAGVVCQYNRIFD